MKGLLLGNFNSHFARTKAPVIFAVRFARKGLKRQKSGGVGFVRIEVRV